MREDRAKWKEAGEIHIIWCTDDVIHQVEAINERNEEQMEIPTKKEAMEILEIVQKYHDCNYGVTWDSIDCAIDLYYEDKNRIKE